MPRHTIFTTGFLAALALLAGLGSVGHAQVGKVSADAAAVAQSNNGFALDLYAQLAKEKGNLFYSPYSISTALGMTYAGAKGQTADEMAKVLHFDLPQDKLHAAMGELVKYLNAQGEDRPYRLSVANRLWGQQGYTFQPGFLDLTRDRYGAGLEPVDFAGNTEQARQIINAWVEKQTQDKIKELIKKNILNVNTKLVLTNAIYFKAPWANPFFEGGTKPADFTLGDGGKAQVPTMHKFEPLPYIKGDKFTAVQIPYKGNALSMIVLLPDAADGLPGVEKSLTAAQVNAWLQGMKVHEVDLKLPKFKVTSEFSLKQILSDMGMPSAFIHGKADFSGISTETKLYISAVIHKAFVDVNEKGTEAAAATAVVVGDKSAPNFPHATFHVNRPFVFLLRDNHTGSLLFVGRVSDPRA